MAEAAQKVVAAVQVRKEPMSILIDKDTKVITQGITGKTGQFHTRGCRDYANGKNCFVAGVNPKKAGEDFEGIPIHATVKDAKAATGATVSVIYVPPAGAAAAIWEAVEADLDLAICITEGIPVRDMLEVRNRMKAKVAAGGKEDPPARPQLPRPDHARRDQDRHHAGPHPPQGPHRRRQPLRHAHLRGRGAAHRARPRPEQRRGHRRRPDQRPQAHRRDEAVQRRPRHRRRDHDRRDRRPRRSRSRALVQGTT